MSSSRASRRSLKLRWSSSGRKVAGRCLTGIIRVMLRITKRISIDESQLEFSFSRSGGPGGQNVNKLNTRATVFFDVAGCEVFSKSQKKRILRKLATRINKDGVLRVACQKYRTQKANRQAAIERLVILLQEALKTKPVRKKTRVPGWAKEKRLEEKKKRSLLKQRRTKKIPEQ